MPVVGAVIGGIGSLIGGSEQASASKQAARLQAQTAQQALALQQQMFGTANNALSPYYTAGAQQIPGVKNALQQVTALTTPGTMMGTLQDLPGFQFQSQWGTQAAQNALTAQGLGGSAGPLGKAISDYNNGLAGTYFQNYFNNALGATGAQQNFVNTGMGAGSALAGDAINAGNSMANTTQNIGNAQASGVLGSANALSSGIQGGLGGIGNGLLLSSLLGNQNNFQGIYGGNGPNTVPTT